MKFLFQMWNLSTTPSLFTAPKTWSVVCIALLNKKNPCCQASVIDYWTNAGKHVIYLFLCNKEAENIVNGDIFYASSLQYIIIEEQFKMRS